MRQYSCPSQGGSFEHLQGTSTDKGWGPRMSLSLEVLSWARVGPGKLHVPFTQELTRAVFPGRAKLPGAKLQHRIWFIQYASSRTEVRGYPHGDQSEQSPVQTGSEHAEGYPHERWMSRSFWQGVLPYNQVPSDRIRLVCLGPLYRLMGWVGGRAWAARRFWRLWKNVLRL